METWLISLLTVIGSAIVTSIVSLVSSRVINKQFKKKDEMQAAFEEQKEQKRKAEMNEIVKAELKPLTTTISELQKVIEDISEGTLSSLRNDILTCYYRCVEKGYRNDYDMTNMVDMYQAYVNLHGNSFIKDVMDRFKSLPSKEEFKEIKENKTTQHKSKKTQTKKEFEE